MLSVTYAVTKGVRNSGTGASKDNRKYTFQNSSLLKTETMCVCMYGCMDVCQFPLAAYYGKVARAGVVKFSHKIRPVQPFVVLKFRECATNGVHVRGASLPHFGSGRRRRRVTRAELRFLAVKTERFIPDI